MINLLLLTGSCFLLGIMTSIHPCPLAANIAAISMLSGWSKKSKGFAIVVLLFIGGYLSAYLSISFLLSVGALSIPSLSYHLQKIIAIFLGPALILTGMVLAGLIGLDRYYKARMLRWGQAPQRTGLQAFSMGLLIALSFCPATAAMFFGLLIPLAIQWEQTTLFTLAYALGVALPLVAVSILINRGSAMSLSKDWQQKIPVFAGWIMILVGVYLTIERIYLG